MRLQPDTRLTALPGIGPKTAERLAEGGLQTVEDLLFHVPRLYEDRRRVADPGEVSEEGPTTVAGTLEILRSRRLRGRKTLLEARLVGESGSLEVVWFNQAWLKDRLANRPVVLHGEVKRRGRSLVLTHPDWSESRQGEGEIVCVYPVVGGIPSSRLAEWVGIVLEGLPLERWYPESLPDALLDRRGLRPLPEALRTIHRPGETYRRDWNAGAGPIRRLAYGEFLREQVELAIRRRDQGEVEKGRTYRIDDHTRAVAREILPFRLTAAQKRVVRALVEDLQRPAPMRRLLQGDVGSGKTIVAALLLMIAVESGHQGALLAPTELLAEQHFATLRGLFGERYPIALVTGTRGADAEKRALARGQIPLAVGTHALFQETTAFRDLGLLVIDEQHRFGVEQRRRMIEKGSHPDLLVMSATPIPRSLALTAYGDLESVVLDELPPGRKPVETLVTPTSRRRSVYERLRRDLEAGARGYVVFPVIGEAGDEREDGESGSADLPSVEEIAPRIRERFAEHPAEILHGRKPLAEREAVMARFRSGETRLLVATTVIEVGVDVPEATAMIVEGAERFGLAQLHQLRGRVGRGERPSWCAAIHGELTPGGQERLRAFARHADGFALAEADLALRGPGELLGSRQAGAAPFRFADLRRDLGLLRAAREDAGELVRSDSIPDRIRP